MMLTDEWLHRTNVADRGKKNHLCLKILKIVDTVTLNARDMSYK